MSHTSAPLDFDLDSLLSEALTESSERAKVESSRARLRKGIVHNEEADKLNEIIKKYENIHHWRAIAHVLLIWKQNCSCGESHEFAQGLFLRQQHRRDLHLNRLIPCTSPDISLPRRIEYNETSVHMCGKCAKEWAE